MSMMSKRMKLVFTLSILLNLLLLGGALGKAYHMSKYDGHHGKHWEHLKKDISPEMREVMHAEFKAKRDDIKAFIEEADEKSKAFEAVMAAENFDETAYDAAAAELVALGTRASEGRVEVFKNIAKKLSAEERKALSKMIAGKILGKPMRKKGGKKYKHDKFGKPPMDKDTPREDAQEAMPEPPEPPQE